MRSIGPASGNYECRLTITRHGQRVADFTWTSPVPPVIPWGMDTTAHQLAGVEPLDLGPMVAAYRREQIAAGRSQKYAAAVEQKLRLVADACGWSTLAEMATGSRDLEDWLLDLAEQRSPSTRNNVLTAIRAFAEWLRRRRLLRENPFRDIPMARRHDGPGSRAFSPDEIRAMIAAAEQDEARPMETLGRKGGRRCVRPRALHYLVASWTGLRALELERVRKRHLVLGDHPRLELPARLTKGKRVANLPLTDELAERLAAAAATMAPEDFLLGPRPDPSTIASDAAAAGVAPAGQIGMHSFRKGFITALAAAGAAPAVTQALARHTDPRLTDRVYVEKNLLPLRGELNRLVVAGYGSGPRQVPERSEPELLAAGQVCRHHGLTTCPHEPHPPIPTPEQPRQSPRGRVVADSKAGGAVPRPGWETRGPAEPAPLERTRQELNLPGLVARVLRAIAEELEPAGPREGAVLWNVPRSSATVDAGETSGPS